MPETRQVPIQKTPPLPAFMHMPSDTVQYHRSLRFRIELRPTPVWPAGLMHILPDPENFVDHVARADLELVVCVPPRDEDLEVVLFIDLRIALGHCSPDIRFLRRESEIQA